MTEFEINCENWSDDTSANIEYEFRLRSIHEVNFQTIRGFRSSPIYRFQSPGGEYILQALIKDECK